MTYHLIEFLWRVSVQKICVGVYPYSFEFDPFLNHLCLLESNYKITALISPSGWGLTGKKIETEHGTWTVMSDITQVLDIIDTVYIPSFNVADNVEALILKEIENVTPYIKKIICSAKLSKRNIKRLQSICIKSGCLFENLNDLQCPASFEPISVTEENPSIEDIDVPVVVIAGLWEKTDKFEASLVLREKFIQSGYRITQIGSRNCCELLGFHSFPNYMLDPNIGATNKIISFNNWIQTLVQKEKPDVVILTIPGAVQNLNDKNTKGFGILHHIVFQAISADFLLFCTMYDNNSIRFLEETSLMCKYKFGSEVDCYHMSNLLFDINATKEMRKVIVNQFYRKAVTQALENSFKNSPVPIVNILEKSSWESVFNFIIDKLSDIDVQI